MMGSMRKMAGGVVAKLLMLFLIITFAVWGVGDALTGAGANYAAQVGSRTISISDFQRQQAAVTRRAEAMGLPVENSNELSLAVLRQLVQQELIALSLHDLGLYVSQPLLAKRLRAEPTFQNKDGSFNKAAFTQVLKQERISEAMLLGEIKKEVSAEFLLASLDVSDITPTAPVRELIATAAMETRDAVIVTINPPTITTPVSDEAMNEFYERNKSVLYVKPESRTLEYVTVRPQQIDAALDRAVTSDMVDEAAKTQPDVNKTELRKQLREQQRESVLRDIETTLDDALAGGAGLAEALSKAGISAPIRLLANVKESTTSSEDDVIKTVTAQGFQMGDGETSGLVMTPSGTPVVVHVKSLEVAGAQPFEEVAGDVRAKVAEQQRRDAVRAKVQEVRQALNEVTGENKQISTTELHAVAKRFNLTLREVDGLSRPTGMVQSVNGVPAPLQQAIFEREAGSIAGPLALPNGAQMLAIVTAMNQPDMAAVKAKTKLQTGKDARELNALLAQTLQARSFGYLTEQHRVKINPRLFQSPEADE